VKLLDWLSAEVRAYGLPPVPPQGFQGVEEEFGSAIVAALSKAGHGGAVGCHVSITKKLAALCASKGEVTRMVSVQSAIVDPPSELEDHSFLFRVKARVFGEEVTIKAVR
jgi:hypothetical protein